MDIQELNSMVANFVQVGFMQAVKVYDPPQDRVRKSEVKRWLRMANLDYDRFVKLVAKDIIKPFRIGKGKNSPLYYSKKEIKQAFSVASVAEIIVNSPIKHTHYGNFIDIRQDGRHTEGD